MVKENIGSSEYIAMGFKAIRLKGYNIKANPQHDYKKAKQALDKGFTKPDFKGLSLSEVAEAEKQDFWIGWLVPEGFIVIDSEYPVVIAALDSIAHELNASVQKTNNGKQYIFRCNDKDISAASECFCAGGFPITYRVAGKNYVIQPPTNNRTWENWTLPDKLPVLPDMLLPHDPGDKEQIALCLAWCVGEEYRAGNLSGWEDIDAAFMGYLIERGFGEDFIHRCFRIVFMETYDPKRTDDMYARTKTLKENNKRLIGSGSFVKKVKDLNLSKIKRFLTSVGTNVNQPNEDSEAKASGKSTASDLIKIAEQYYLFHDDMQTAFAWINNETYNVNGTRFHQFIARELYTRKRKTAGTEAMNQALSAIEGKALFDGKMLELHNRVAAHEGAFYYDMGNGKAIKTEVNGWVVDAEPPILFRRYPHQAPQALPEKGGELRKIFDFMNVTDDKDQLLMEVTIVSFFVPGIPHPVIYAQGGHGTGKTKGIVYIKKLVDPSKLKSSILSNDKNQLIQTLSHHYFCLFDNISIIPDWTSDVMSMAVTGGAQSRRKLYSDEEDLILTFMRCVALTAINMCITRSDLLDRTILINFDQFQYGQRKEEAVLDGEFEKEKPRLLGAIFDTLSKAMRIYPDVKVENLPRMADFCRWGCAIAIALGYEKEDFLEAYGVNVHRQNQVVVNTNVLAQAVLIFMEDKAEWSGFMGELYKALKALVEDPKEDETFPKYPNKMRSHFERIAPNLKEYGIEVFIAKNHTEKGTSVTIINTQNNINKINGAKDNKTDSFLSEVARNMPDDPKMAFWMFMRIYMS